MELDKALIVTVAVMVLLVLLGQPGLAVLAGLLGVLFIGASGSRYVSFKDVGLPEPGGYPGFEFWKELVKETGEFLGKQTKKYLRTEQAVDAWSSWVKKAVYENQVSFPYWFQYGPFAMNVEKDFAQALQNATIFNIYANQLRHLREIGAIDEKTYKELMKKLAETLEKYAKTED